MTIRFLIVTTAFLAATSLARAQGGLTPPGSPGAMMKSLAQIEPRTPISGISFITQPGSYYLTTNIVVTPSSLTPNALQIGTNGVTLDLNGFTISSTVNPASGSAISVYAGTSDLTILNGHIVSGVTNNASGVYSGAGFQYGVWVAPRSFANVRVSGVSVSGVLYDGINAGTNMNALVDCCLVNVAGGYGIVAGTIKTSSALNCGNSAICGNRAAVCQGVSSAGYGVYALDTALNCYGVSSNSVGVDAQNAVNCFGGSSGSEDAIYTSTADNCNAYGYGPGPGLTAITVRNCHAFSATTTSFGIYAVTIENSFGESYGSAVLAYTAENTEGLGWAPGWPGLYANTAENCYGITLSTYGIEASFTATGCAGSSLNGTGLSAFIANACSGSSGVGGTPLTATHNINSFSQ